MSFELTKIKIHSKRIQNAVYYLAPILFTLGDIALAIAGYFVVITIFAILSRHIEILEHIPLWMVSYVYIGCSGLAVLLGLIHFLYWHYFKTKLNCKCHHCGEIVTASSKTDAGELNVTVDPTAEFHMYRNFMRTQIYRPRLHYTCNSCGNEEYICPYCHQPIGETDSKCPHCGKRNAE